MKIILIFLYTVFSAYASQKEFDTAILNLENTSKIMNSEINFGTNCIPEKNKSETKFCTGFSIDNSYIRDLFNKDVEYCFSEIKAKGYKIISSEDKSNDKDLIDFKDSFSNARTLHDKKVVYFRQNVSRAICVHELIHIFQYNQSSELSPAKRKNVSDKFKEYLDIAISELKKEKNVVKAKTMEKKILPFVDLSNQYVEFDEAIDEKEVHYFILKTCRVEKCTFDDNDISLSNLAMYRKYLKKDIEEEVLKEITILNKEKKEIEKAKAANFLTELVKLNKVKAKKIIGMSVADLIKYITTEEKISNMSTKEGIFNCSVRKKELVKDQADINNLVNGYLYSLMEDKYCFSKQQQQQIHNQYLNKLISRKEFESNYLYHQAITEILESEFVSLKKEISK